MYVYLIWHYDYNSSQNITNPSLINIHETRPSAIHEVHVFLDDLLEEFIWKYLGRDTWITYKNKKKKELLIIEKHPVKQ